MQLDIVILAAGSGRRLRSAIAKPLLPLAGKPLLAHVLKTARQLSPGRLIVVTPPASPIATFVKTYDSAAVCVVQESPRGTADALRCAMPHVGKAAITLVLCADTPLLSASFLRRLKQAAERKTALALLTFSPDDASGYGRIIRNSRAVITGIVEERDADEQIRAIKEVYAGVMAAPSAWLHGVLEKIDANNAAGERYLTDLVGLASAAGRSVRSVACTADDCSGVNTAADLEQVNRLWRHRQSLALLQRGVRLVDATRVDIRGQVKAGQDVEIDVNVILAGDVVLAKNCRIGAHCFIEDCQIGEGTVIEPFSHLVGARIGAGCQIGPYARLRRHTHIASSVRIGNFVEVKNSHLKKGVKAGHLAYLGDSIVGERTNVGAGAITCNYDGRRKHQTIIGRDVFIGSDAQLIAPVKIGNGAYIAAGSTITRSVSSGMLALSRTPQKERLLRSKR